MYQDDDVIMYEPLSDEEIKAERGVLQPGVYDFEVMEATKKTSKSNYPMIELKLKVWGDDGRIYSMFDWLLPTHRKMAWKIKHFWESVGQAANYNGQLSAKELIGKTGKVRTKIEQDNKGYDQARVEDYANEADKKLHEAQTKGHLQKPAEDELDDDIPF